MKSSLEKNTIVSHSRHNEEKSAVAERFIKTLKSKIYKYMASISKNVYIDKLDDIVNKYNNAYHSTIKMKPADVKSNIYIDSSKEINDKEPKLIKIKAAKGYVLNWSEEGFMIKRVKTLCCEHMFFRDLKGEKIAETFTKKNCEKQIKRSLELKK